MTYQTQSLDVGWEIGLLKAGKASYGYDVVGLGVPVGHTNAALSTTVTVAKESESFGVHAAWASTFHKSKVNFPVEVFKVTARAWLIRFWRLKTSDHLHLLGSHQHTTFVDAD